MKPIVNKFSEVYSNLFLKNTNLDLIIGSGFALSDTKKKDFILLKQLNPNRKGHTQIFGTTRVGKTRLAENCIAQDIRAKRNVIIIDPKIDNDLFNRVYEEAVKCGRASDFILLSSVFAEHSIKIAPLSHFYLEDEPINHLLATVPSEDDFFYKVAQEILTIAIRGYSLLIKLRDNKKITELKINEIAKYTDYENLIELKEQLEEVNDGSESDVNIILELIRSIEAGDRTYFEKVSKTVKVTLTQLRLGTMGKIIGNVEGNEFIRRLEENEGLILYVQTGALLQQETAFMLGKLVLSMLQSVVGRYFASGLKFEKELAVYIDEMSNVCYRGIEDLFNKSGGANCYLTGLTQSPVDLVTAIGEDRARKILDNTNTKIIMRMNDTTTAKSLITYGGTKVKYTPQLSLNGGMRTTEMEEEVLRPTDFLELEKREFYYFGFEGKFKGKTAPVGDTQYKITFPKIVGVNKDV